MGRRLGIFVLTGAFCMMVCFGCSKGEEKREEAVSQVSYDNESSDKTAQNILMAMLGENISPDGILYDVKFPLMVDNQAVRFHVEDSNAMSANGKLTGSNNATEQVIVTAKTKEKEYKFCLKVVSGEEREDALMEQAAQQLLHNTDNVRGNLNLVEKTGTGDEIGVEWKSDKPEIITDKATGKQGEIPAGVVNRGETDEVVILHAVLTKGDRKLEKDFSLNVKAKPQKKTYDAYVYTYFRGNIYGTGESQHIHMAVSKDGFFWDTLNDNEPILKATEGTKGVRDSFLIRSPQGDHFYLIGTDLDANGGDWGKYGNKGSKNICVWESDDLVNWSEERLIEIAPQGAGCMWAPEAFYDNTTGEYVVYWASGIVGGNGKKIYYAKTRDFYHFSKPEIYKDVDGPITYIDTTMIEYKNTYYRFTKNENELSILMETSHKVLGDFSCVKKQIASEFGVEGPAIYQINGQEKWCLYMDGYADQNAGVGYFPLIADSLADLKSANFRRLKRDEYQLPEGAKHGSFVPITKEEYEALKEQYKK